MLKFFVKITILITLIVSSLGGIILVRNDIKENYFAAIADKHQFAQSIKKPKIILAGGSNLAFGIASDSLEKAVARPVVNLGLYVGFGLDFMLQETLSEVKKGDLVVLSTEYYLKKSGDDYSKQMAVFAYPPASEFVGYNTWLDRLVKKLTFFCRYTRNLIFFPNRIKSPKIEDKISDYFREGFSLRGDLLAHLNNPPIRPVNDLGYFKKQDYFSEIVEINRFADSVRLRGGDVYWYFPSYSKTGYQMNVEVLKYYEKQIDEKVNCLKINRLIDEIYPDDYFYDSPFHLTNKGRMERTKKLINTINSQKSISQ